MDIPLELPGLGHPDRYPLHPGSAHGGAASGPEHPLVRGPLFTIPVVWVVASICEEVLARGLLQTMLGAWSGIGWRVGRWRISLPVWLSGLLFGAGHLILWPVMGPATLGICVMTGALGVVAGQLRASTGSLWPAILVHVLFNVGGSLPGWIL